MRESASHLLLQKHFNFLGARPPYPRLRHFTGALPPCAPHRGLCPPLSPRPTAFQFYCLRHHRSRDTGGSASGLCQWALPVGSASGLRTPLSPQPTAFQFYCLRHRGLRPPLSPGLRHQGLADSLRHHRSRDTGGSAPRYPPGLRHFNFTAYGTGDSVPRKPPGLPAL